MTGSGVPRHFLTTPRPLGLLITESSRRPDLPQKRDLLDGAELAEEGGDGLIRGALWERSDEDLGVVGVHRPLASKRKRADGSDSGCCSDSLTKEGVRCCYDYCCYGY